MRNDEWRKSGSVSVDGYSFFVFVFFKTKNEWPAGWKEVGWRRGRVGEMIVRRVGVQFQPAMCAIWGAMCAIFIAQGGDKKVLVNNTFAKMILQRKYWSTFVIKGKGTRKRHSFIGRRERLTEAGPLLVAVRLPDQSVEPGAAG